MFRDTAYAFRNTPSFGLFNFVNPIESHLGNWSMIISRMLFYDKIYYCFYFVISIVFHDGFRTTAMAIDANESNDRRRGLKKNIYIIEVS